MKPCRVLDGFSPLKQMVVGAAEKLPWFHLLRKKRVMAGDTLIGSAVPSR